MEQNQPRELLPADATEQWMRQNISRMNAGLEAVPHPETGFRPARNGSTSAGTDREVAAARLGFADASRKVAAQYAAGADLDAIAAHHDDVAADLRSDAQTPFGRAYAREYAETSASLIADLRADAAAATRPMPGPREPHPDRPGWEGCPDGCGIYVRRAAEQQMDREAG